MTRKNSGGVVEDIWMNTRANIVETDTEAPPASDIPTDWDELEEANAILNPDEESMDWHG